MDWERRKELWHSVVNVLATAAESVPLSDAGAVTPEEAAWVESVRRDVVSYLRCAEPIRAALDPDWRELRALSCALSTAL